MAPTASPPSIEEAVTNSTTVWQDNLQALFDNAKDWFPDVVWEVLDEDQPGAELEEVWGHKGMVYARAPPSFQARYFQFRPAPITSPTPYSASATPIPAQSSYSLSLAVDFDSRSPSPSPFRGPSPSPSANTTGPLRLMASMNSVLFAKELEYLYTGKGLGEAFEFLFDTSESRDAEDGPDGDGLEPRVDKLRKDLVFMWRSRLYSDVRIALEGTFSSTNHEPSMAVFSSHRFMLVARSPYFLAQFVSWGVPPPKPGEQLTVTLPSPPCTPAAMHFTLGYIYTGTLVFSHRSYDLDTAFAIMRCATYLQIDALYDEVQARIAQEMLHGLFHAFLEFAEYERLTGGRWAAAGCRCRSCARRAPRVLAFASADDVKNAVLERGARRALVGLFGEGWANPEFAALPDKTRAGLVAGVAKRSTPQNAFALLFAANHALERLAPVPDPWADTARDAITAGRKTVDRVLCDEAEQCFEQLDWLQIMDADGVRFEDHSRVVWVMEAVQRGLSDKNAAGVYQTLVSSILLRPHPTETSQTVLAPTSRIRDRVELARMDVIRYLKRRWLGVRQENGFEPLHDWALTEISHEIDVPIEELLAVAPTSAKSPPLSPKTGGRLRVANRPDDAESMSMHSARTGTTGVPATARRTAPIASSASSVHSTARSVRTTASRATAASTAGRRLDRPDSKLTPSSSSVASSFRSAAEGRQSAASLSSPSPSPRKPPPLLSPNDRTTPRSSVASVTSVRSRASTIRKSSASTSAGGADPGAPSGSSRPTSNTSTAESDATFKSAKSDMSAPGAGLRPRRSSTGASSVHSTRASRTPAPPVPSSVPGTPRIASGRSSVTSSIASSVRSRRVTPSSATTDSRTSRGLSVQRSTSAASSRSMTSSMRSSVSTASSAAKSTARKTSETKTPSSTIRGTRPGAKAPSSTAPSPNAKGKGKATPSRPGAANTPLPPHLAEPEPEQIAVKRKSSADTIRESRIPPAPASGLSESDVAAHGPPGATLDIGIPCIITSKRAKFRALARYIGEVAGEAGPWVGVEVPVGDNWASDRLEGRAWHDGTWGGIRYFDLGSGSEWELDAERAARRRRLEAAGALLPGSRALKREGDQLSVDRAKRFRSASPAVSDVSMTESRGLFVRPQQVLYVVDAVGSDF